MHELSSGTILSTSVPEEVIESCEAVGASCCAEDCVGDLSVSRGFSEGGILALVGALFPRTVSTSPEDSCPDIGPDAERWRGFGGNPASTVNQVSEEFNVKAESQYVILSKAKARCDSNRF